MGTRGGKRGQIAIYVIVAILIVGSILGYVLLKGKLDLSGLNGEFVPIYSYYSSCIESEARAAVEMAGVQGGRVEISDYVPGSEFAPFSNQLNFLGIGVPYWFYISGNGVIRENVPSMNEIEREVADYISENVVNCDFSRFYDQGYEIELGDIEAVRVNIENEKISIDVKSGLSVSKEESSAIKSDHKSEFNSKFGKFYNLAREIYDKQKQEAFLEDYAVDVLRLYAPVDGVEVQCNPLTWKTNEVLDEIKNGLEVNIQSIKLDGNYYTLNEKKDEYFVVDKKVDENVNFLFSREWPTKIEINGEGVNENLITAEPLGNQEGLGVLGFCYVPYHFVYDLSFPVLVQIYNNDELFQFPVAVIIDNNLKRQANLTAITEEEEFDLCEFMNNEIQIELFDTNLNRINGFVSYECFDQRCFLGETKNGVLIANAPACVNGFLHVTSEGYAGKKELFSTNEEYSADIILEKEYEVEVQLEVGGRSIRGDTALISFVRKDNGKSTSVSLPETNKVKLGEGEYEIRAYVYGNSSITIPASTKTECQDVPRAGLAGLIGSTKEQCFDIETSAMRIDYALIGGGKGSEYILESELEKGKIIVQADGLPSPNSLEQLQYNFASFEGLKVSLA